jgi:hypothetical protein
VACVEVPEAVLNAGLDKCMRLLGKLRECIQMDHWPGVANNQWYQLALPNWAMPEDDVLQVFEG